MAPTIFSTSRHRTGATFIAWEHQFHLMGAPHAQFHPMLYTHSNPCEVLPNSKTVTNLPQVCKMCVPNPVSVGSGAAVNWPTPIVASANLGAPVSAMQVLIDGQVAYAAHGDTINTAVKVFTGTHHTSVQSLDSSGNPTSAASLTVDAEPEKLRLSLISSLPRCLTFHLQPSLAALRVRLGSSSATSCNTLTAASSRLPPRSRLLPHQALTLRPLR